MNSCSAFKTEKRSLYLVYNVREKIASNKSLGLLSISIGGIHMYSETINYDNAT